jgi:hypothetical protein
MNARERNCDLRILQTMELTDVVVGAGTTAGAVAGGMSAHPSMESLGEHGHMQQDYGHGRYELVQKKGFLT